MDKEILKRVGITEDEFKQLSQEWQSKRPIMDKTYLQSPEGRLMDAIYGKKN